MQRDGVAGLKLRRSVEAHQGPALLAHGAFRIGADRPISHVAPQHGLSLLEQFQSRSRFASLRQKRCEVQRRFIGTRVGCHCLP